jgi:hypothetical protein
VQAGPPAASVWPTLGRGAPTAQVVTELSLRLRQSVADFGQWRHLLADALEVPLSGAASWHALRSASSVPCMPCFTKQRCFMCRDSRGGARPGTARQAAAGEASRAGRATLLGEPRSSLTNSTRNSHVLSQEQRMGPHAAAHPLNLCLPLRIPPLPRQQPLESAVQLPEAVTRTLDAVHPLDLGWVRPRPACRAGDGRCGQRLQLPAPAAC